MGTDRMNSRAWRPNCYITETGLVCTEVHVKRVCTLPQAKAALATTAMIERMMKS